jgi:hypothetical protein
VTAYSAVRTAGPLRAFRPRIHAQRGRQLALVPAVRKLTVIASDLHSKLRTTDSAPRAPLAVNGDKRWRRDP